MASLTSDIYLARARTALEGLSVGDAFGERFLATSNVAARLIVSRALPALPWRYTDDSEMALSIVANLRRNGSGEYSGRVVVASRIATGLAVQRSRFCGIVGVGASQSQR